MTTAQREVARAEQTGVISSRWLGNTRLVAVANSPLTGLRTEVLLRPFGPRQVVAIELASVKGIDATYLFGSWAVRYTGQLGMGQEDIDALVIGRPDRDLLDQAARRSVARLAR